MKKYLVLAVMLVVSSMTFAQFVNGGSASSGSSAYGESNVGKVKLSTEVLCGYVMPSISDDTYYKNGFSMGMSVSFGARYFISDEVYAEGMAGYKWISMTLNAKGHKSSKYDIRTDIHDITVPLHLGYKTPSGSFGVYAGTRIDIPVSAKTRMDDQKRKADIPVTACIEGGFDIRINEDSYLRLQYSHSPSDKNKYSEVSVGLTYAY